MRPTFAADCLVAFKLLNRPGRAIETEMETRLRSAKLEGSAVSRSRDGWRREEWIGGCWRVWRVLG